VTDVQENVSAMFLAISRQTLLEQYWPRLRVCAESMSDQQVWWRPNEAANSIGNLLLHLNGNVRQWLVASFNGMEDDRNRAAEFDAREVIPLSELLDLMKETMQQASDVLARLTTADLTAAYDIQGYHVSGLEVVYHVVEHFGMHYGQILYIAKTLGGADLGFYRELNATGRAH
jgi:uncharacterized damage-inducible protein DinB